MRLSSTLCMSMSLWKKHLEQIEEESGGQKLSQSGTQLCPWIPASFRSPKEGFRISDEGVPVLDIIKRGVTYDVAR